MRPPGVRTEDVLHATLDGAHDFRRDGFGVSELGRVVLDGELPHVRVHGDGLVFVQREETDARGDFGTDAREGEERGVRVEVRRLVAQSVEVRVRRRLEFSRDARERLRGADDEFRAVTEP